MKTQGRDLSKLLAQRRDFTAVRTPNLTSEDTFSDLGGHSRLLEINNSFKINIYNNTNICTNK